MKASRLIILLIAVLAITAPNASAGLVGPLPDVPPYPVLVSGPANGSVVTTPDPTWTYTWNGQSNGQVLDDPGQDDYGTLTHFNCSLDGAPAGDCGPTFNASSLPDGAHSFAVNATYLGAVEECEPGPPIDVDPCQLELGYQTSLTLQIDFVIDTSPPALSFSGGLGDGATTRQSSQRFTFNAADAGAFTVTCSLDSAPPAVCASPFDVISLGDGAHSVTVIAADTNGHSTTISRRFVVDSSAPVAAFTGAPKAGATIHSNHPTFTFASTDLSPVSYSCIFDGAEPVPCASPFRKSKLASGPHFLVVTPTDAVGNAGAPIARMFTYKPVKRCVKHKHVRSKHGKQRRVCAKYRLGSI